MALQRPVGVDFPEANEATIPSNRDTDEPRFSQSANKLDSFGAISGPNVQSIAVPVFESE
jgi:hypothetical protein